MKLAEAMPDGRLRFEQEMGRQSLILQRSTDLVGVELARELALEVLGADAETHLAAGGEEAPGAGPPGTGPGPNGDALPVAPN